MDTQKDDRCDLLEVDIGICDGEERKWRRRKNNYKDELRGLKSKKTDTEKEARYV